MTRYHVRKDQFGVQRWSRTVSSVQHPTAQTWTCLLPVCDPAPKAAAIPATVQPAKGPAPSRPDLCSSPGQSILPTASLIPSWPLQMEKHQLWGLGPKIPACKITAAAAAAVQCYPFNLSALVTVKTPQGLRQEHTNTSGLAHSQRCTAEWWGAGPLLSLLLPQQAELAVGIASTLGYRISSRASPWHRLEPAMLC